MTRHQSFAPSTGAFVVVPEENEKSEPFSNRKQVRIFLVWWARVDSNHRSWKQQIYSLSPLATREHAHIHLLHIRTPDDLFILAWEGGFVNCLFYFFSVNSNSIRQRQERMRWQVFFTGTGRCFGATAEKRRQKLYKSHNLLHYSCKKGGKVLS